MSHIMLRPLPAWTDPVTPHPDFQRFKASWGQTTALLRREVDQLNKRFVECEIIVQLQTSEYNLRKDGGMKADAKVTGDGVVISFESRYGPLRYATDQFRGCNGMKGWEANVRAIALGLEALRKVDRYGISRRGEQYTGFGALPAARPMEAAMTTASALELLHSYAPHLPMTDSQSPAMLYKIAAKATHPDTPGGDAAAFRRVKEAYDLLSS